MTKHPLGKRSRKKEKVPLAMVSMTGFGRATAAQSGVSIEVEIKSVNSRFLDSAFRLPREYAALEPEMRELLSASLNRGRVEVSVSRNAVRSGKGGLRYDRDIFSEYLKIYRQAFKESGIQGEVDASLVRDILARREVLDVSAGSVDAVHEQALVLRLLRNALAHFSEMRAREGLKLAHDMAARLSTLRDLRDAISQHTAFAPQEQKRKLQERLEKLLTNAGLDEARLCSEAAFLADKIDVSEELLRLESHFAQFAQTLGETPNGRKLEFLLQEFGREFNTIASKAQDASVQQLVVDAKTEIEKIREQVQNVE